MDGHDDRCPRCGGGFHCGARDAATCPCTALTLAPALLAQLRQQYSGCLCLRCLAELAAAADASVGAAGVGSGTGGR